MSSSKRLTDDEVAAILRCTPRGVRRLRKLGRLAYLPGRPPTIEETDLKAYIENTKVRRTEQPNGTGETDLEKARERARKQWQKLRGREQGLR